MKLFHTDGGINNGIRNFYLLGKVGPFLIKKISGKLNNFFVDAVKNLNIPQYEDPSVNTDHIEDPIIKPTEKFENHYSTKLIKGSFLNNSNFSFDKINVPDIEKESKN